MRVGIRADSRSELTCNTSQRFRLYIMFTMEVTIKWLSRLCSSETLGPPAHQERREGSNKRTSYWTGIGVARCFCIKNMLFLLISVAHKGSTPFFQIANQQFPVYSRVFSGTKTETFSASFQVRSKGAPARTDHYVPTTARSDWG